MHEKISYADMAQRVIEAYAHDLEGLTLEECYELGFDEESATLLTEALAKGAGGRITDEERHQLVAKGFMSEFLSPIMGTNGKNALRERARWLSDNLVTSFWRSDFDEGERRGIALELGDIGPVTKEMMPALIEALDDPAVRDEAIEAIGMFGPKAKRVVPALIELVGGEDRAASFSAVQALGEIGSAAETAVPAIIKMMRESCCELGIPYREAAVTALGKIAPTRGDVFAELVEALDDIYFSVRQAATKAIANMGPEAEKFVPGLMEKLDSKNQAERVMAVRALGAIGPVNPDILPAIERTCCDPKARVRAAAVEALGDVGPEAVPVLLKLYDHCYTDVAVGAERVLIELGPAAFPQLVAALADDDVLVRARAADRLKGIDGGAKEAAIHLIERLNSGNREERIMAARALGLIGPAVPEVLLALIETEKDDDMLVRVAAGVALTMIEEE